MSHTTIQVSTETREVLEKLKVCGESHESVIKKLLGKTPVKEKIPAKGSHAITLPRNYEQVPSGEEVYVEEHIPMTGIITTILMLFPAGASARVGVQTVYYPPEGNKEYLIPSVENAWVSLDSHVAVYDNLRFKVKSGGKIRVKLRNEGDYAHYIQVDMLISRI